MITVDFTRIKHFTCFDDEDKGIVSEANTAKIVGNLMKYQGPVVMDIGFEELARTIYFSDGPVEIEDKYVQGIREAVSVYPFIASIKRALLKALSF